MTSTELRSLLLDYKIPLSKAELFLRYIRRIENLFNEAKYPLIKAEINTEISWGNNGISMSTLIDYMMKLGFLKTFEHQKLHFYYHTSAQLASFHKGDYGKIVRTPRCQHRNINQLKNFHSKKVIHMTDEELLHQKNQILTKLRLFNDELQKREEYGTMSELSRKAVPQI